MWYFSICFNKLVNFDIKMSWKQKNIFFTSKNYLYKIKKKKLNKHLENYISACSCL